jgi:hypothetical protein
MSTNTYIPHEYYTIDDINKMLSKQPFIDFLLDTAFVRRYLTTGIIQNIKNKDFNDEVVNSIKNHVNCCRSRMKDIISHVKSKVLPISEEQKEINRITNRIFLLNKNYNKLIYETYDIYERLSTTCNWLGKLSIPPHIYTFIVENKLKLNFSNDDFFISGGGHNLIIRPKYKNQIFGLPNGLNNNYLNRAQLHNVILEIIDQIETFIAINLSSHK